MTDQAVKTAKNEIFCTNYVFDSSRTEAPTWFNAEGEWRHQGWEWKVEREDIGTGELDHDAAE